MNGNHDTTDYRAKLVREMSPGLGEWIGPRRIGELLDGFAAQVIREHQKRDHGSGTPLEQVLSDALIKGLGYTREAADHTVDEFRNDHESYRMLADAVGEVVRAVDDPDDWDGDDSEVSLLMTFVAWLPDMVKHRTADSIRDRARQSQQNERDRFGSHDHETELVTGELEDVAADVDPFERDADGRWVRKSDGEAVPWPVVKE